MIIDIGLDCAHYEGDNLVGAMTYDGLGFCASLGSGYVIGVLALSCTNPYSFAVVGTVVVATVVSGIIINEGVSSAKNTYLTRK